MTAQTNALDLSKYLVSGDQTSQPDPLTEESPRFDLSQFEVLEGDAEEGTLGLIGRNTVRTGVRALESVLGIPGDLGRLAAELGPKLPGAVQDPNFVQRAGQKLVLSLPTTDELKVFSSWLTSGYTDPQSAREEFGDEVTSLATLLAVPGRAGSSIKNVFKAIGQAMIAKSARKGAEALGAGEGTQTAVELGVLGASSLFGKAAPRQMISEKFQKARALIPEGAIADTTELSTALEGISKDLAKGIKTPIKDQIRPVINELQAKASTGAMAADEVVQSYHDLNSIMRSKKLFTEMSQGERRLLKKKFGEVKTAVNDSIVKIGESNPEFLKEWNEANQALFTLERSEGVNNWISSKVSNIPQKLVQTAAFEVVAGSLAQDPVAGVQVAGATLGAAGAAAGTLKMGKVLFRIANNKDLAKHYTAALSAAAAEDLPAFIREVNRLDKELQKDEKKSPIEFQEVDQ